MKKTYSWSHPGRESIQVQLEIENETIQSCRIQSRGCLTFLKMGQEMKKKLKGPVSEIKPPEGTDHSSMIWRELIFTIKDEWLSPVAQEELCHCRRVSTQTVDRSIVYGAHTIEEIRLRTSANTGCGTCKEDVSSLISHRMKTS